MANDIKDLGNYFDSGIHSPHSYTHLFESWHKLLEVVEDSSKGLSKNVWRNSQKHNSELYVKVMNMLGMILDWKNKVLNESWIRTWI